MEDSSDGISTSSYHSFLHAVLPAATYRPIVIFCIGIWGWGLNLYLLNKHHIDTNTLLQIHSVDNKHAQPLYRSVLMLALYLTTLIGLNMFAYWFTVDPAAPSSWLPVSCYLTAMGLVLWPGKSLYRKERVRFLRVLRRLFSFSNVHFADVIMADILTSFSNVFGDLFTTGCSVLVRSDSEDACHRDLFVPLLISIPYIIRLRQCLSEYFDSGGRTRRHLWNAIKYASAFPVIIVSATQKRADRYVAATGSVPSTWWISDINLFRLWMVFVIINSMYSFWWDISVDWSLIKVTRTTTTGSNQQQPSSFVVRFRKHLHFSEPVWYFGAMVIDFVLRTTWSLKLSSHLYVKRLEGSIFMMEFLEVIRRWVWVIFRMENEWVKRSHTTLPSSSLDDLIHMDTLGNNSKLMPIREEDEDKTTMHHTV